MKKIVISLLFFLNFACSKNTETNVTGTVVNSGSKNPIEGVKIILQDGLSGSPSTVGSKNQNECYSDDMGRFSVTLKGSAPFLWAEKDSYRYINLTGAYEISQLAAGNDYNIEVNMDARAMFNPIFYGKNCNSTDTMVYDGGRDIPLAWPKMGFKRYGKGPHISYGNGLLARGDHYYVFWIKYQINSKWHEKIDSVYIKSFTTFNDTIYY